MWDDDNSSYLLSMKDGYLVGIGRSTCMNISCNNYIEEFI